MRARGDAVSRHILNDVSQVDDPRLVELAELLRRVFPDPDSVLGLDRLREFVATPAEVAGRHFRVLVAQDDAGRVVGGSVFSYVPATNCGFSEYLVLERSSRGMGLGRQLFDRRRAMLDVLAAQHGERTCRGLFIEADSPERTPPDVLAAERDSAMDALERLRLFQHLGFHRVELAYVQPPLGPGKQPVDYLDLLFAAWQMPKSSLPVEWVVQTLTPIWSAWTPRAAEYLVELRSRIGSARLLSLAPPSRETAE